jgi:enoyl-CoA hydratase/carnithine racemase
MSNLKIETFPDAGYAIVTMNKPPVNALNTELITELTAAIDSLEKDSRIKGFVLASALSSIFSAGLDITMMINPDRDTVQIW